MSLYDQDRNASAEILRLVLQRMGKQEASFTPPCYAVWYQYVAGLNHKLTLAVDDMLARSVPLDDAAIHGLYEKYVSGLNSDTDRLIRDSAQRILNDVMQHAQAADHKAYEYGDQLEQSVRLLDNSGAESLRAVVTLLQSDTQGMRSAVQNLQGHLQHSQQEIEKLRVELENARVESLTDPLTGTLNRRGFESRFSGLLKDPDRENTQISLIMLDIDHFKKINDTYGHLFGDKVIRAIAEVLKANIKGKDAAARLGGEEFCVLLPETPLDGAQMLADKIRQTVEKGRIRRLDSKEEIGGITISLGVAELIPAEDSAAFINRADQALYISKERGRNRVSVAQH